MTAAFKSWLPEEALRSGLVERTIRDAAHDWSEAWLARQFVNLLDAVGHPSERPRDLAANWACRSHAEGVTVALAESASLALAGLMLGRNIESSTLTPADKLLLESLAGRCIEDLCQRLSGAFGLAHGSWQLNAHIPAVQQEACFYRLGLVAGSPLMHVTVDTSAAVALIKSSAKSAEPPSPLRPIEAALEQQQVLVSAQLGRAKVSVSDLAGLGLGDVLVLDRDLTCPLELAVNGNLTQGQCGVEESAGGLQLKILQSLSG